MGLITGTGSLMIGAATSGTTRLAFIALGLTLPGLLLQDSWRYSFFALGKGGRAFANDAVWALTLVVGLLALKVTHHQTVFWYVLTWGVTGGIGALVGPFQAKVWPRLIGVAEWVHITRDLGPRYLLENTANSGSAQLRIYFLGFVTGLTAVGYVQEGSLLMGPFFVIFMGISLVTVPEAARTLKRSPRHLMRYCVLVGAALCLLALSWGVLLMIALPHGLGPLLLKGNAWRPVYALVPAMVVSMMGACAIAGATAGLRVQAQPPLDARVLGHLRDPRGDRRVARRRPGYHHRDRGGHLARRGDVVVAVAAGAARLHPGRRRAGPRAPGQQRPAPCRGPASSRLHDLFSHYSPLELTTASRPWEGIRRHEHCSPAERWASGL
jgi:hypothetical protein